MDTVQLDELKLRKYAKNSERKVRWGVKAYNVWKLGTIETSGVEYCDSDILSSNLDVPKNLEKDKLCRALCKFSTEVQKCNEGDYQPNSLKDMIISIQMYLNKNDVNWKLLNRHDEVFVELGKSSVCVSH